uniref:Uncharacterized protein n=1 Tax=viral metagenome TaxID=1070528 RepID=A0A6C0AZH0_9ZZZZ
MSEEFIKMIGIFVIIAFLLYVAAKSMKFHMGLLEGLTNPASSSTTTGIGSSAANYAITLKNQVAQLHNDILLMSNKEYVKEYGNIILSMDDYINALMLKTTLMMNATADDVDANLENIKKLNELNSAKSALNNVLKYVDSV